MGQLAAGAGAQKWSHLIAIETVGAKITEGRWVADRLVPGGVMMQWLQVGLAGGTQLQSAVEVNRRGCPPSVANS